MLGINNKKLTEDKKVDPCLNFLEAYTNCVSEHTKGLSEGDDCGKEAKTYKDCRKEQKAKNIDLKA